MYDFNLLDNGIASYGINYMPYDVYYSWLWSPHDSMEWISGEL